MSAAQSAALLEVIRGEAIARALAGRKLDEVRVHPESFKAIVAFTGARVTYEGVTVQPQPSTMCLHIDGHGPVIVRSESGLPNDGRPRFSPAGIELGATPSGHAEVRATFEAGYHAGWEASGEGHNAEYSKLSTDEYASNVTKAWLEFTTRSSGG